MKKLLLAIVLLALARPVCAQTTVVQDTFTNAEGTTLNQKTPEINAGTGWEMNSNGFDAPPWVQGGLLRLQNSTGLWALGVVNSGIADGSVASDWFPNGAGNPFAELLFRFTDPANYLSLIYYGGQLSLWRVQGSNMTSLVSTSLSSSGTSHHMEVRLNGSAIEGWWDGVLKLQATDSFNQTATRSGLRWVPGADFQSLRDNFRVQTPPPAPPVVDHLVLSPSANQGLAVGASLSVSAQAFTASNQVISGATFTWAASNANVSLSASTGAATTVTGATAGSSVVTAAAANGVTASLTFTVTTPPPPPLPSSTWGVSGYAIFAANSGNVGIGTVSPLAKLHVDGDTGVSGRLFVGSELFDSGTALKITDAGYPGYGQLQINAATHANYFTNGNPASWIIGVFDDANGGFSVRSPVTGARAFYATSGGYLGLGTTTPLARLHVSGDVIVDGNIAAKYQDVAEWVRTKHPLAAGTVVVAEKGGLVGSSKKSYDTAVIGVVSPQPGIALGEAGDDKILVAQSGRVRVKVDASYGAVHEGDLLVTSPKTGVAMRSKPMSVGGASFHRPGTLIGKALEPLSSGEGEILVLLTLQ